LLLPDECHRENSGDVKQRRHLMPRTRMTLGRPRS
jgi:hypothetical protein